jgi:putative solute:sodium symporter small subunit
VGGAFKGRRLSAARLGRRITHGAWFVKSILQTAQSGGEIRDEKGGPAMAENSENNAYWSANLRIIGISLVIWFVCSFGFGILLRPLLSGIKIGGTDLGFWFAQQGSILVFLVLIFTYAWRMNKLDREHGVEE